MKFVYVISILFLLSVGFVSAFDFPHTIVTITVSGNLTNLSEMLDVNIPTPTDNQLLQYDTGNTEWVAATVAGITDTNASTECSGTQYLAGNGSCLDVSSIGGDTNETTRFNALVNTNCTGTDKMTGVQANGTVICAADQTGGGGGTGKAGDGTYLYNDSTTMSFNATYAEINLEVNGSDYWDEFDTANTTWFENIAGVLSLKLSQLTSWVDTWLGTKTTDDLTEGSTNLYDNSSWNETYADTLYADISNTDTNETSFVNNLTTTDCTAGELVIGIQNNGTVLCATDTGQTYTSNLNFSNDANYWNDTYATFNKTYADGLYASISITGDNSSWNKTYADTLYAALGAGNSSWNETYANTLYADISVTNTNDGNASSICSTTEVLLGNGTCFDSTLFYDGLGNSSWNETYANTLYAILGYGDDWNKTYADTLYADISVTDTTYSHLTNFTDDLGDRGYTHLTNFTDDLGHIEDDAFWNKTYADTLYAGIGAGNSSWNETYANTLYADISVTGDDTSWNKTYADTLYAILGYGDDWNKTYADTLYAVLGSGNSSWNETYANTLYADISVTNTNDGNASSICSTTEVLLGNGTCFDSTLFYDGFGNSSFNQSLTDTLYIVQSDEGNLNVNSSDYWDEFDTANTTWFENIAGVLSLKLSQLTSWVDTWLGTKTTDDLTEGSTNLYNNNTFNQSLTDSLYAVLGSGNSSWNETYANTLYADISVTNTNDGNASSICSGETTYLDGEGNCDDISSVYASKAISLPATNITTGTFGTGNYIFDTNVTIEKLVFETSANNYITDNATCVKIYGATSIMEIC